jgi:hypothetical protein
LSSHALGLYRPQKAALAPTGSQLMRETLTNDVKPSLAYVATLIRLDALRLVMALDGRVAIISSKAALIRRT